MASEIIEADLSNITTNAHTQAKTTDKEATKQSRSKSKQKRNKGTAFKPEVESRRSSSDDYLVMYIELTLQEAWQEYHNEIRSILTAYPSLERKLRHSKKILDQTILFVLDLEEPKRFWEFHPKKDIEAYLDELETICLQIINVVTYLLRQTPQIVSRDLNSGPAPSHSKTDILIGENEDFKMLTYLCNPKYYQNAFEHGDDPGEIRPNGSRVSYNHNPCCNISSLERFVAY